MNRVYLPIFDDELGRLGWVRFLTSVILQGDGQEAQAEGELQPDKRSPQSLPSRMGVRAAAAAAVAAVAAVAAAVGCVGIGVCTFIAVYAAGADAAGAAAGTGHTTAEQRPQQW